MQIELKRVITAGTIIGGLAVMLYLAYCDPTQWPSFKCPFHALTGLECPGCGSQRAIHAIFNGDFAGAWAFNPALFFAIPLALLYAWSPSRLYNIMYARATFFAIIAAIILYWIMRNII